MERKRWCEWITDYYYCVQLRFPLHLRTAHGGITASETTTINQSKKPLNKTQKEQKMLSKATTPMEVTTINAAFSGKVLHI